MLQRASLANTGSEASIADLLSDPIARSLMRADDVSVDDVMTIVRRLRRSETAGRRAGCSLIRRHGRRVEPLPLAKAGSAS